MNAGGSAPPRCAGFGPVAAVCTSATSHMCRMAHGAYVDFSYGREGEDGINSPTGQAGHPQSWGQCVDIHRAQVCSSFNKAGRSATWDAILRSALAGAAGCMLPHVTSAGGGTGTTDAIAHALKHTIAEEATHGGFIQKCVRVFAGQIRLDQFMILRWTDGDSGGGWKLCKESHLRDVCESVCNMVLCETAAGVLMSPSFVPPNKTSSSVATIPIAPATNSLGRDASKTIVLNQRRPGPEVATAALAAVGMLPKQTIDTTGSGTRNSPKGGTFPKRNAPPNLLGAEGSGRGGEVGYERKPTPSSPVPSVIHSDDLVRSTPPSHSGPEAVKRKPKTSPNAANKDSPPHSSVHEEGETEASENSSPSSVEPSDDEEEEYETEDEEDGEEESEAEEEEEEFLSEEGHDEGDSYEESSGDESASMGSYDSDEEEQSPSQKVPRMTARTKNRGKSSKGAPKMPPKKKQGGAHVFRAVPTQ
jgi:hypothetical protein